MLYSMICNWIFARETTRTIVNSSVDIVVTCLFIRFGHQRHKSGPDCPLGGGGMRVLRQTTHPLLALKTSRATSHRKGSLFSFSVWFFVFATTDQLAIIF